MTMKKVPKIKSVMTPFPYDVGIHEPIGRARKIMMQHKVRHLPVTHDHILKGLVSDRDIKLILGPEFGYPNPKEVTVEDVMVDDPYVVDIETSLITVLDEMAARHIGTALVTKDESHETVNPTRIVPKGPAIDFAEPHDRERLPREG